MPPPKLDRRRFAALAAAAVAVPAARLLRAQLKVEKPRVTIACGGKAAFYYLPLTIAEQLGFFQAEGVDVEVTDHAGGTPALQAALAGQADVVSGAYEHTINLQSRNQHFQSFVVQGRAPQIAMGVSAKTMPGYRNIGELRGKRIGITAPGSSTNMVAALVLARGGLKAADVSFVGVGNSASALTALRTGQVDAICNTDPVMTMLEQKGEVRIISDTRTLKGTQEVFGGPMPAACLYASMEFVDRNPATCQALTNAIVHSLKWLQTAGPSDLIKAVPEAYLLGDRALYLASFNKVHEAISVDGILPEEGARTALKAIASFEPALKPEKIALAKTYTNDFARRAKQKFKA
ncbi:ABC transporter substrate-binding protein [Ramlibacter sp. G-1-2-2]|uniref:ABC transporter substrate-binding protein n=1 Tax=Ramlibacter agri TaxID=2728837 RepID=A0A848H7N3_9BURK|nr:ABC transporter substrate-binding protein [Ramlibacter agri]NML45509.1 ABC transporter substrate-binding protein [Ramlibacter agri]